MTLPQLVSKRVASIDILRGIVMVIMALDHARDYYTDFKYDPTDIGHTTIPLFFTRWITHFCAPVFIFLAGTSAFLSFGKNSSKKALAWRLLSRGIWMLIAEVTVVRYGWAFDFDYSLIFLQVIWAIGWSMIVLSGLVFLPLPAILVFGLMMIFGHNMLDNIDPQGEPITLIWRLIHNPGLWRYGHNDTVMVLYPIVPWIGVMAAGYCFGSIFALDPQRKNRVLYGIGVGAIALFVLLRAWNVYGDPSHWSKHAHAMETVLSFLNCSKYPPSLLYLLMTLGPAIALLPLLDKMTGRVGQVFTVYGRVPMFYYILHIYLLHSMAMVAGYYLKGDSVVTPFVHPGYTLPSVYIFWLVCVILLYLPCRWYMRIKMKHKHWVLSYI